MSSAAVVIGAFSVKVSRYTIEILAGHSKSLYYLNNPLGYKIFGLENHVFTVLFPKKKTFVFLHTFFIFSI